ncbi:hypothetical protein SAMD00019534_094420 [Acytostelium subglobosum LB1]|uniref:hypothetical protein n=1 Tax=Acytostelium subglobosum LB1 TaxID=1410327 RepID=UPI000644E79C|nr:hypothetical protein SAMD00019534_094420 [Acytostelium subglobosum LB1]GAM26267.1 hypothetical protein SAMD00019534_094420 [Acytostelium subglobosum LB1]|eukprot:XP_012750821.1 hypothetical protein SAMD00019534_094420 [Acytostelium subglobosum LB1]
MVVETSVLEIDRLGDVATYTTSLVNNNNNAQSQVSQDDLSFNFSFVQSNSSQQKQQPNTNVNNGVTQQTPLYRLKIGDQKSSIDHYLHPKYNILLELADPMIKPETKLQMTNIITTYPMNPFDRSYGKLVTLPTENIGVILKSGTAIPDLYQFGHINGTLSHPTLTSWLQLRVTSIDAHPTKVTDEIKWNNQLPHDRHFEYFLKQCVYLVAVDNTQQQKQQQQIKIVFWDMMCKSTNLFQPDDILLIHGLFYNQRLSTELLRVFEATSTTVICTILPAVKDCNMTESQLQDTEDRDMSDYPDRVKINQLESGMHSVSLVARIVHVGKIKLNEQGINSLPLLLSDSDGQTITLVLSAGLTRSTSNYRVGQLCFFSNLFVASEVDKKKRLYGDDEKKSKVHPISTLIGILNSRFLYRPIQSLSQQKDWDNTVVSVEIVDLVLYDEQRQNPLFAFLMSETTCTEQDK